MKMAIVCDWLVSLGGAEKVLADLISCFPEADLFAILDFVAPEQRGLLANKHVKTSFIQKFPYAKTQYRTYLPLMPFAVEQFDLSPYDVILSSSHAVAKGVITGPNQLHISYVHSPMRYVWDLQHQYLAESGLDKKWIGWLARYFLHKLRDWDVRSANHVDHFITNSQFIAKRIHKVYRRQADVIYPGVNLNQFQARQHKEAFYLTASRLVPYKKIDLTVKSFNQMPDKKLVVIGDGPEFTKIKKCKSNNVELLGYQPNAVLIDYLQRAQAFIFAAEEDFGLLPVEAQACGTPVIAYGKGGVRETVIGLEQTQATGVFFHEQTVNSLCQAINTFEQHTFNPIDCVTNAKQFSQENFQQNISNFVHEKWHAFTKKEC